MTEWNNDSIRALERGSIRAFMERNRQYLRGRVLDFGAGKPGTCAIPEPYRDLVDGEYVPVDKGDHLPDGPFGAIICTQALQYIQDPESLLSEFRCHLAAGGYLVMTGPTNWAEVEDSDLQRFTLAGIHRLLRAIGFSSVVPEIRATISLNGFNLSLGYGVVACK